MTTTRDGSESRRNHREGLLLCRRAAVHDAAIAQGFARSDPPTGQHPFPRNIRIPARSAYPPHDAEAPEH